MTKPEYLVSKKMTVFVFAAIVLLLIAAAVCFLFFDQQVIRFLHKNDLHWGSNKSIKTFQYLGKTWLLTWLILFWAILTRRNHPAILALLAFLAVGAIVLPTKFVVQRERPGDFINRVYEQKNEDHPPAILRSWSFPSGDTASVFAIATVLLPFIRRRIAVIFFAVSCCVGLLRILVFAHYPSDVFGGAAAGIFSGWLILRIFQPLPLPSCVDTKAFFAGEIVAFILLPLFLAASKFHTFIDIVCTYGLLLALIYIAFIVQRKYGLFRGK